MNHASPAIFRPHRALLAAAAFLLAALFPAASRAMLVSLTLSYSSLSGTNLQPGSIVQVIAYNTSTPGTGGPGSTAETNFDPYGTNPSPASGVDAGVFQPDTVIQPNHYIVYTGHLTQLDNGDYGIVTDFTMDDTFNALYVRVFEATDFPQGSVVLSHWGVGGLVTGIEPTLGHYSYNVSDIPADKLNYFEVIPEPATLSLFAVGTLALAAFRRKRNPNGKGVRP